MIWLGNIFFKISSQNATKYSIFLEFQYILFDRILKFYKMTWSNVMAMQFTVIYELASEQIYKICNRGCIEYSVANNLHNAVLLGGMPMVTHHVIISHWHRRYFELSYLRLCVEDFKRSYEWQALHALK